MKTKKSSGADRLILFCRYPVPGRAKTRLIPAIGALNAADLHRRLAERAFRIVRTAAASVGAGVEVRFDGGDERRMRRWLGGQPRFARQGQGDLGPRMQDAFEEAFQEGCLRVVLLGTDVPGMSPRHLETAMLTLRDHDVVLGPSRDGGYWLIGMKRAADVFRGVHWGTSAVLGETLQRVRAQGLSIHVMEPESDLDTIDDVRRWRPEEAQSRPYLSVVIPALNEEKRIAGVVASARHGEAEVIVVDGGSRDRTVEAAREAGARVISSRAGRAAQQNRGAASALGRVLLFLHADTRLPTGYTEEVFEVLMDHRAAAGAFRFRTDLRGPLMRGIEIAANLRAAYLRLPYGDQALFMRKEVFDAVAGFPDQPIAEDLALVRRLSKRGGIGIASADAVTSGRRWDALGILRTTLINWVIACGCLAGISAHRLAPLYRIRGKRRPERKRRPALFKGESQGGTMTNFDEYRSQFPITEKLTFMNHAAISPLPLRVEAALESMLREYCRLGIDGYPSWMSRTAEVRKKFARLIHAKPQEIAFVGNTSEGLGAVASGIDWKPGDLVMVPKPDFPANIYPWMNLERRGVKTVFFDRTEGRFDTGTLEKALRPGVRLLSVSSVDFSTGYLCDLAAIGEFCRKKGIFFCVDAIQSLGVIPMDVRKYGIHFLAAGGHKWLLSVMGCAVLFVSGDCSDQIHPDRVGWKSVVQEEDFFNIRLELKRDALRFEPGTMNIPGIYALGASIEMILSLGVGNLCRRIFEIIDQLYAGLRDRGLRVITSMAKGERSGILSFIPELDPISVYRSLNEQGIRVSLRNQMIRLSPHFYNNEEDVVRFFQALDGTYPARTVSEKRQT